MDWTRRFGFLLAQCAVLASLLCAPLPSYCQSPAATPTFSPVAGTYNNSQSVTILDTTTGATIYYTINGTTPTTSSAVYSSPIVVSSTETVEAIATAPGHPQSAVASGTYTISGPAPAATPNFFPPGGTYPGSINALISDPTPNVVIYYTTDGTTPTTGSPQCSNNCIVPLSSSATIQAMATASGYLQSSISSVAYTLTAPVPAITGVSPVAGLVGTVVTISGVNFEDSGTVTFNGIPGSATSWGMDSIAVSVPVGATSGQIVVTTSQGASNGYPFTIGTGISNLTPSAGSVGTSVVIAGNGFGAMQGNSTVTFSGVPAIPSSWSDTSITVPVPQGATTGNVAVQINGLMQTGPVFTLVPSITGLSPSSGPIGTMVTISGSNFGAVQGGSTVTFGQTLAAPTQWSQNTIDVPVPSGALSGSVVVTVAAQSSNSVTFAVGSAVTGTINGTVTQSDGVTPVAGATVMVFEGSSSIATTATSSNGTYSIGNLPAATYIVQVTAAGFGSGEQSNVSVSAGQATVANLNLSGQRTISYTYDKNGRLTGVADSASGFASYTYDAVGNITSISNSGTLQLAVLGFSPASGTVGATLSVVGTGFAAIPGDNSVTIGGANASVISGTATQLVVTVPGGATTGPISVTTSSGSATSNASFIVTTAGAGGTPSIGSFIPAIGASGTAVTISGSGFNSDPTQDIVRFNGQLAAVSSATTTSISTAAPAGAVSGPISVTTAEGSAVSSSNFIAIPLGYTPSDVDFAGQLVLGGLYSGTISSAGNIGLVNFTAAVGEEINLAGVNVTVNQASFSILKSDGSVLAQGYVPNGIMYSGNAPVSGSYEVVITQTSNPGNITLVLSTNAAGTIAAGTPSNVTINTPGQDAELTFTGVQGQLATIQLSGGTFNGFEADISILTPSGGTLFSNSVYSSAFFGPIVLPATGTYTLMIVPEAGTTGSVSVSLSLFSNQTGSISPGESAGIMIGTPGQTEQLTFTATEGQVASVSLSNSTICGAGINLSLLSPDGSTLATSYVGCSSSFSWITPTLPGTGTYTLVIAPQNGATGSATVAVSLSSEPLPNTISPGISLGLNINTPGQNAQLTFTGNQGQLVSVLLSNATFPNCETVSILAPDGSTLASPVGCGSSFFVAPVVLPETGTYTLVITPQSGGTGNATVLLSLFNEETGTAISSGTPVGITINTPGQDAQLTFTGTAGQLASVQLSGVANFPDGVVVSILSPDGATLANNGGAFLGPVSLPATGTYTLVIAPQNGDTGTVTAGLSLYSNLNGGTATSGTPVNLTIGAPGQNAQLTFMGSAGQFASVQLSGATFPDGVTLSILSPDGTTLISGGGTSIGPITLPATGTYTVIVAPQNGDTGTVTVSLSLFTNQTGGTISSGTPVNITINYAGQNAQLTFTGTQGQWATIQLSNSTFPNCAMLSILTPDGTTLALSSGCGSSFIIPPVTLPIAGSYTIVISPQSGGTGSVTVNLSLSTLEIMSPGTPAVLTVTAPGQSIGAAFGGLIGQSVTVQISSSSFNVDCSTIAVNLLTPAGSIIGSGDACNGNVFGNPIALLGTGLYVLQIVPPANGSGSATFSICLSQEQAGSITSGTPTTVTISNPNQNAQLTFSGTAGQSALVQLSNISFCVGCNPYSVTILSPDGNVLTSTTAHSPSDYTGPVALPATGTYTLVISSQSGNTGSVSVLLLVFNELSGTSIIPNTPTGVNLSILGQSAQLTFAGTQGQLASISLAGTATTSGTPLSLASISYDVSLSVINPDGTTLATGTGLFLGPMTLPATGTYTLLISLQPYDTANATVVLSFFNEATGSIVTGTPTNVTISTPGQDAQLTFAAAAGQWASVQLSGSNIPTNTALSIISPDGTTLASSSGAFIGPVTAPTNGTYTLVVVPPNGYTGIISGSLSLSSGQADTTISSGTPANIVINVTNENSEPTFTGTAGQLASVVLQGASFPFGLEVSILGPDGTTLASIANPNTFFLGPVMLPVSGTYTLVISSFDGTGDAVAHLWLFNNVTGTIAPGTPFGVNIGIPGQIADLSFSGTAGQTTSVLLSNVTFALSLTYGGGNLAISILNPDGTTLISNSSSGELTNPAYGLTPVTLPVTGVYALVIAPQGPITQYGSAPPTGSATVALQLQ